MFAPTNPEIERIRAEQVLRALTEYREDGLLFAPKNQETQTFDRFELVQPVEPVVFEIQPNRTVGQSIMRVFKALRLNRRPVVDEPVQRHTRSPRTVTTSGRS